jgi:hypothetical protein
MPFDPFEDSTVSFAPATRAVAVNLASDTVIADSAALPKAVYVGGAGVIIMRGPGDTGNVTWNNCQAGSVIPFRPVFVASTANGTTATGLLLLY